MLIGASLGGILFLVGYILILIAAFNESVLWGLLCLIPIVALVYAITRFEKCKNALILMIIGMLLGGGGAYVRI